MTQKIYGYYDSPDQPPDRPAIDPDHGGPCLFCGEPLVDGNVLSHSMLPADCVRCFFYRTHRTCYAAATPEQRQAIDHVVIDSILHHKDGWPEELRRAQRPA